MSAHDIYEDGFPHGTREGYEKGCRSNGGCPERAEGRLTCSQANIRYSSDWQYKRLVDAGKTPAEIHAIDEEHAAAARTKTKPKHSDEVAAILTTAADSGEPIRPTPKPAAVPTPPPARTKLGSPESDPMTPGEGMISAPAPSPLTAVTDEGREPAADPVLADDGIALEKHGTTRGYSAGCRRLDCPGIKYTGQSCRQAAVKRAADNKRAKRDAAAAAALTDSSTGLDGTDGVSPPDDAESGPVEAHVPHEEIVADEVAFDFNTPTLPDLDHEVTPVAVDRDNIVIRLAEERQENARLREQLTMLTLELDVAKSQVRRNDRNGLPRVTVDVDRTTAGDVTIQLRIPA